MSRHDQPPARRRDHGTATGTATGTASRASRWLAAFGPYDPATAATWLSGALALSAAVVVLMSTTTATATEVAVCLAAGVACLAGVLAVRRGWQPGARSWLLVLAGTSALVTAVDIVTGDASVTGMVFFLLPPVVAAGILRPPGAWAGAVFGSVGALVTVLVLMPAGQAVMLWAYLTVLVVFVVLLLSRAVRRSQDLLAVVARQATRDPLTGLVTRRVLDESLRSALAASGSGGAVLVVLDVDHFKSVNDSFGHPAGDQALTHVSALLRRVAGGHAVVSRLGGDELAMLLTGAELGEATARAQGLVDLVRRSPLVLHDGRRVHLSVSAGVAHRREGDAEGLYRAADDALYAAKRAGRDQVAVAAGPAARGPAVSVS